EAWKVADRLKDRQVPVLVRMNYTDQPQGARRGRGFGGPPPAPATPAPPRQPGQQPQGQRGRRQQQQDPPTPAPPAEASGGGETERTPQPKRVEDDQKRLLKEEIHNAAVLREKGVQFAISTQGQTGNAPADRFRENLRKAIAEGLSPE